MFLRECPGGTLGREQLLAIYEQFFPFGDSAAFVGHLFRLYDVDESGAIDFEEYLSAVSITTRGKLDEKLQWAFRFYDQDGDGRVSASDMTATVDAIYRMMGGTISLADDEDTPAKRVEKVFKLMGKVLRWRAPPLTRRRTPQPSRSPTTSSSAARASTRSSCRPC